MSVPPPPHCTAASQLLVAPSPSHSLVSLPTCCDLMWLQIQLLTALFSCYFHVQPPKGGVLTGPVHLPRPDTFIVSHGLIPWFHRGGGCSDVHREGRRICWRVQHNRTREGSVSRESERAGVSTGSCPKEVSFEDRKDQGSIPTILQLKKKVDEKTKQKQQKRSGSPQNAFPSEMRRGGFRKGTLR